MQDSYPALKENRFIKNIKGQDTARDFRIDDFLDWIQSIQVTIMPVLKYEVFGKRVSVVRTGERWLAYYESSDGKRRPARDIVIPSGIDESDLGLYLYDLCHEWATDRNPDVIRLV